MCLALSWPRELPKWCLLLIWLRTWYWCPIIQLFLNQSGRCPRINQENLSLCLSSGEPPGLNDLNIGLWTCNSPSPTSNEVGLRSKGMLKAHEPHPQIHRANPDDSSDQIRYQSDPTLQRPNSTHSRPMAWASIVVSASSLLGVIMRLGNAC